VKLQNLKNAVTSRVGRRLLTAQKHSPQLLFAAGVVGVVGTVVLASRATLKIDNVLDEHNELLNKMEVVHESGNVDYTENDFRQDKVKLYARTTYNLVKLYGPSILVGAASIAALTGSHVTLNRRYAGVTAAYAALDKGFRQYRERVLKEVGPEKEREFRYDTEGRMIVEETEEGPVTKTIRQISKNGASPYARLFDEINSSSWAPEWSYNQLFLRSQQNYANDLLRARGHVLLNEVYDMLGLQRSKEGCVVGWVLDGGASDNYIDFGIFDGLKGFHESMRFVNGEEQSIWLDFNVDGVVYDKI
jgi:hypothetical protein